MISWNVNGFRSVLSKGLGNFVASSSPDVICLQEIKCDDVSLMEKSFADFGYTIAASPAIKKGYSGTLTAWKNNHLPSVNRLAKIGLDDEFINEGRVVEIDLLGICLINLYVPSGSSSPERQIRKFHFMDQLLLYISDLAPAELSRLMIVGDMNICHEEIDIHHPDEATRKELSGFLPDERKWFTKLLLKGLSDSFRVLNPDSREYTWWSFRAGARGKNLGWRLDYALCGKDIKSRLISAKIHKAVLGSDHCPIEVRISL
ncbi:MAG TPA: exodeoxyribonuclease III [Oligoflexia bacterium]|nr:exodeoxyribonuclease III [Oligoflexia bacterium]